ncbi:hypothetical protein M9458_002123, partial [Cirrhinus mrigala]
MLLGEDTGYMDITHSHTITIDEDYDIEKETNPDLSINMAQTVRGDLNVSSQKGLPREAKAERKNAANDSDFSAFLASMSLPTVNTIKLQNSESQLGNIFSSANTSTSEIDKENHLPSFLMKQHPVDKDNSQQPRGLQRRRSRVAFVEDDDLEVTKSHTVVIENKDNAQPFTPSVSENQRSVAFTTSAFSNVPDDMELTLSQTAAINIKVTGNITRNVQTALDHNRSQHFPEDDNAMEMTGAFDASVREKDHTMSMIEQAQPSVPTIRRMSSFNMVGNGETTVQNKAGYFQSNLSVAQTANSDDMEMTGTFDVPVREKDHTVSMNEPAQPPILKVMIGNGENGNLSTARTDNLDDMEMTEAVDISIQEKEEVLFPKTSKMSTFDSFGNGEIVDQNKFSNNFIAPTANPDDMEMTQCQTIVLEDKQSSGNKPFSNSRKSLPLASLSRSVREDEHTGIIKEEPLRPVPKVRRMSSLNVTGNGEMGNLSIAQTAHLDDMEMTGAVDISIQEKKEVLFPKASKMSNFDSFGNGEIVDRSKSSNKFIAPTANLDDMEMTQCQTIVFEDKQSGENKPFSNSRKSLPLASLSRSVREDEYTGNIKEEALRPAPRVNKTSCFDLVGNGVIMDHNKSGHLSIAQTANSDEMEMTQCQTIFLEAKQVSGDKPLSNTRKNWPHTSVSGTEGSDGMDMTHAFTGRIILNALSASKKERGESILMPATTASAQHNESDCMDLTCQQSIFDGISPPSPNEMELTRCTTINIDSTRTWLGSAVDITSTRRTPFSANQTITVVEPMEMTEVHMAPISEQKHKAFMTRRKSGARMMPLICDAESTEADNRQTDFSNPDDMDMTQCQTVVLEAENYKRAKPFSKSRKSLNLVSTSSSPDVDGMEITQALTGNIVLKSFVSNEQSKQSERNLLPAAQSCQTQDESDCMEMTCQASASNLAIPCVDDEMELTGCNTIAIHSKSTLAASATEIKAHESALWASTSVSRCTVASEEQNEVSEAAKCAINHVFPSKHVFDLDSTNIKCNSTEKISYCPADMQVDKNVMTTDEDDDMQVTNVLTMPIEIEKSVSFNEKEEAHIKTFCDTRNEEEVQALWHNKEQSTSSVQIEGSSSNEFVVDSFIKEELQHAKARRRSLADFQMELHNMSRRIQEEHKVMTGSTTVPLPSYSLPENSLKEQCEMDISSQPTSNVTPNVKQINNSVQNEKTTPFSLKKKAFSSRLSLCGIVPKLPKRATTATPNKTVTISTNDLQCLQLEKHFDVVEQTSSCKTVDINDEELPEMSSEEDLSRSLENWPINKQDSLDDSLAAPKTEEPLEDTVFESATSTSPCFKRPHPEEDPITAERTKKACVSDM